MMSNWVLFLQDTANGGSNGGVILLEVIAYILFGIAFWGIFSKAGQPAWAGFVPIYNLVVLLRTVGRPVWWIILMFIPIVNIVVGIIVYYELAKSFGYGAGFTVGLILLGIIFLFILGFGGATYRGPAGGGSTPAMV